MSISEETAITALCIWEHATENREVWEWLTYPEGAFNGRDNAIALAPVIDELWEIGNAGQDLLDGFAFDWSFIPAFFQIVLETNTQIWEDDDPETPLPKLGDYLVPDAICMGDLLDTGNPALRTALATATRARMRSNEYPNTQQDNTPHTPQ